MAKSSIRSSESSYGEKVYEVYETDHEKEHLDSSPLHILV